MGLDVYLIRGNEDIEIPSAHFPEHTFKIGYFRSSYNDGGVNAVLKAHFDTTLADLFGGEVEKPDWAASRQRALNLIDRIEAATLKPERFVHRLMRHKGVAQDAAEALSFEAKERDCNTPMRAWHTGKGAFFRDPVKVVAVVNGNDCTYLVTEEPFLRWYLEAIKIVVETCDWVLAQPNVSEFSMRWSG